MKPEINLQSAKYESSTAAIDNSVPVTNFRAENNCGANFPACHFREGGWKACPTKNVCVDGQFRRKGVGEMPTNGIAEKIDALYDMGRELVERKQLHGFAVESEFNVCDFDQWRRKVNELLFALGGCEDVHYQRFSKGVINPRVKDLETGLHILAEVRENLAKTPEIKKDANWATFRF